MLPNKLPNKSLDQLKEYAEKYKKSSKSEALTTGTGRPIGDKLNLITAGAHGPLLMQDFVYLDEMAHFDRERAPERVVHAKGAGAFGYFEVTHDITKYTKAIVFDGIGKRTPVAARFSIVMPESGGADTARDPRGFAMKFYTEHGIWDMVANNIPIFFIRDPILFPSLVHSQKRNPVTHLKDANMFWDFLTLRQESCHMISFVYGDRGTPDGYRFMDAFGANTFKLVNAQGVPTYCKFHFKSDQGIRNLSTQRAIELAGENPDYATQDLFNAIANGEFPSWTMYIQVMTMEEAQKCKFIPFDVTKVWPHSDFPLIQVGKLVFNRNPTNYFAEVEQIAFSPSHLIPGIEASPDKMLQGRLFSYPDTHRHRLGENYLRLPINCPYKVRNYQRNGPHVTDDNGDGSPNYFPNSFGGPSHDSVYLEPPIPVTGVGMRYDTSHEDNYSQCGVFWRKVLDEGAKTRLIENISMHLVNAAEFIQDKAVDMFGKCDEEYGRRLKEALQKLRVLRGSSSMREE